MRIKEIYAINKTDSFQDIKKGSFTSNYFSKEELDDVISTFKILQKKDLTNKNLLFRIDNSIPITLLKGYKRASKSKANTLVTKTGFFRDYEGCQFYCLSDGKTKIYTEDSDATAHPNYSPSDNLNLIYKEEVEEVLKYTGFSIINISEFICKEVPDLLDDDVMQRLEDMFSSEDEEMWKLGFRLMMNFLSEENKEKLSILFRIYPHICSISKESKFIYDYIRDYNYSDNMVFWIEKFLKYPNDPSVIRLFNKYIKDDLDINEYNKVLKGRLLCIKAIEK